MRRHWILALLSAALWAAPPAPAEAPAPISADQLQLAPLEQLQLDAINYAQAQSAALAGHYSFRVVKAPAMPHLPAGTRLTFEPSSLSRHELGGMFFVTFKTRLDGRPAGLLRVDLEGKWTGQLLRAKAALARKTVPEASQFEAAPFEGNPPAGAMSELPAGYRLRTPVAPGHVLTMTDLEPIPVVTAGDQVRVELVSGDLVIAVEALARTSGALGEKVRVEMPSHKNLQVVVTGPGEARVQWAGAN